MATKDKPGKFDCYANALPDEPMFVLLARDDKAPARVREWANAYRIQKEEANAAAKLPPRMTVEQYAKYSEALDAADAMESWRTDYRMVERVKKQKRELDNAPRPAFNPPFVNTGSSA